MTEIAGFTRHRIALPGITLSVQTAGAGDPLILLHGFPENGLCWSRVAPAFTDRFHVIIPDLRGYGQSDAPPMTRATTPIPNAAWRRTSWRSWIT